MRFIKFLISLALLLALGLGALLYVGWYDVAADVPHSDATVWLIDQARDRSVEVRARGVQVPRLDDEAMVREGAGHYAAMCAGCHGAPGQGESEMRKGLYPKPPQLTGPNDLSPAEQFWVIKHGIKMSAMPAWGTSHDDQSLWNIVAFVQKLPGMTPEQYQALAPAEGGGPHHHDHDAAAGEAGAMPDHAHGAPDHADPPPPDEAVPNEKPKPKDKDEPEQHETRP